MGESVFRLLERAPNLPDEAKKVVLAPATERGRRTRRRILSAAETSFGERGYFPTSIADIVREAGVAPGTFYLYFRSKEHVFAELLHSLAQTVRKIARAASAGARDRIEEEQLGLAAFFSIVHEHPHLYRIVRQAEFVDPQAFRNYYATFVPGYVKRMNEAMERGTLRRLDAETLAHCLMGIADFVGMRWPYWTGKPIPDDVFDSVMQFIRFGVDARGIAPAPRAQKRGSPRRQRAARNPKKVKKGRNA